MKKTKTFDCVEMKRRIQESIYEETKNMNAKEMIEYFHRRIATSEFSSFLKHPHGIKFSAKKE